MIESIGSYAFNELSHLQKIDFVNVKIGSIEAFAFATNDPIAQQLNISFTAHKLNETKFSKNSFLGSKRKVFINVLPHNENCSFWLNELYFKPFLDETNQNFLNIECSIDCGSDSLEKMSWIFRNLTNYKNQIHAKCWSGNDLLEKPIIHTYL